MCEKGSVGSAGLCAEQVLLPTAQEVGAAVLTNLPFGHVPTKVLLPVGAKIDLLVEGREALLLWGHQH